MTLPARRHKNSGRTEKVRLKGHRQWVAGHECLIAGKHECWGKIVAAHFDGGREHAVPIADKGGHGLKNGDNTVSPLCWGAHDELHSIGTDAFERKYGVDLLKTAQDLWFHSPQGRKCRRERELEALQ